MHTFANRLQHFDIYRRCTPVVSVVLVLVVAKEAPSALRGSEGQRRLLRYAGHDGLDVQKQDRRIYIHVVRVQDLGELEWR